MEKQLTCFEDGTKLERDYGIAGIVWICPKCHTEYVWSFTLQKLFTKEEFCRRREAEQ